MTELSSEQASRLFAAIRAVKGAPLVQTEVDTINRALMADVAEVARSGFVTSADGVGLIQGFETLELKTYKDPGPTGLPITGGWGSTRDEFGKPLVLGVTKDQAYWNALFLRDLQTTEHGVNLLIGTAPTTQNQFDAFVSFAYNVGLDIDDDHIAEGLGDSTLLKKHLAGDWDGCRAQFALWNKSNGKVLNGLTRRRAAEAALYGKTHP